MFIKVSDKKRLLWRQEMGQESRLWWWWSKAVSMDLLEVMVVMERWWVVLWNDGRRVTISELWMHVHVAQMYLLLCLLQSLRHMAGDPCFPFTWDSTRIMEWMSQHKRNILLGFFSLCFLFGSWVKSKEICLKSINNQCYKTAGTEGIKSVLRL